MHSPYDSESQTECGQCDDTNRSSCFDRFKYELFSRDSGFFDLEEKSTKNMKCRSFLDVEKAFAPFKMIVIPRILLFGVTIAVFFVDIFKADFGEHRYLFLGYLTNWTWVFTILFQIMAVYVTLDRKALAQPEEGHRPSLGIATMWTLYSLAYPANVFVVVNYWTLVFPSSTSKGSNLFRNVFKHGMTCLFVFIDGHLLSKIPLRMKQMLLLLIYGALYLIWTIIHGLALDIGNGKDPDKPLYTILNWEKTPAKAVIVSTMLLLIGLPFIYILLWAFDRMSKCGKFDGQHRPLFQK